MICTDMVVLLMDRVVPRPNLYALWWEVSKFKTSDHTHKLVCGHWRVSLLKQVWKMRFIGGSCIYGVQKALHPPALNFTHTMACTHKIVKIRPRFSPTFHVRWKRCTTCMCMPKSLLEMLITVKCYEVNKRTVTLLSSGQWWVAVGGRSSGAGRWRPLLHR